jgi:hypothetical protein
MTNIQTRSLALALKVGLNVIKRAPFLGHTDFPALLENNAERILNLPGAMPFFSTRRTDINQVKGLIEQLHPLATDKPLIRFGPSADGGYLIPDDLDGIKACFSPGVSTVAGFELDCAKKGMEVFMADASVAKPPVSHPNFHFIQKFIGASSRETFISLEDWVQHSGIDPTADLLLQMDIEGYEYESLLATPRSVLERFRIIVIEFHFLDYLLSEPIFAIYRRAFEKLLMTHACVHVHPNNLCPILRIGDFEMLQMAEFTFLRRDRVRNPRFATEFPHPLDRDNSTDAKGCPLPKSFFRQNPIL